MTRPDRCPDRRWGPAGLAAATGSSSSWRRHRSDASVVVIEKAPRPGYHNLSGASFEAGLPGRARARLARRPQVHGACRPGRAGRDVLPSGRARSGSRSWSCPRGWTTTATVTISLSRLTAFLAAKAEPRAWSSTTGIGPHAPRGEMIAWWAWPWASWPSAEWRREVEPPAGRGDPGPASSILADGDAPASSRSSCADRSVPEGTRSLLPSASRRSWRSRDNPFGTNRVMHTLGFPNPASVFGGGFLYSMGEQARGRRPHPGLDWKYGHQPQREFER